MPRVAAEGGEFLCSGSGGTTCVTAPGHEDLQPVRVKASAICGPDLRCKVGQVLVEAAEVVEVLTVATPFRLIGGPGSRLNARHAGFEGVHVAVPAAGDELVFLA